MPSKKITMPKYTMQWLTDEHENGKPLKYLYFWGNTANHKNEIGKFIFSQWYESPFTVNGITYKTSEHWMMAHKALLFNDQQKFEEIVACNKPGEAKDLGRQVSNYNDDLWNERKFDIVKEGNIHKFSQHKELGKYLIQTGNRVLVEASPVDVIWGVGLTHDNPAIKNIYSWRGQNLLGFVLMEVREYLNKHKLTD